MSRNEREIPRENSPDDWWASAAGFFGEGYMLGDASAEGYLPSAPESLEQRTEREVRGVLQLMGLSEGDRHIDVPCGYGRHVIELSKRGIICTGIDINAEHLARARQNDINGDVEFLEADMRSFSDSVSRKFTSLTNMFFSFGFFRDEADNERVAEQFANVLVPGGKCLVHTDVSPEMIDAGHYRFEERRKLGNGSLRIKETYDRESRRLNGTWSIWNEAGEKTLTPYSVRIYSEREFVELLQRAGFHDVRTYGSFNGEDFTPTSEELVVVGVR